MLIRKTKRIGLLRPLCTDRLHGPKTAYMWCAERRNRPWSWLLAVAAAWAIAASSAQAGIIYYLDQPNSDLTGFTGPYGTVEITLIDSTHADILFQSNTVGYLFGAQGAVAINVNANSFSMSNLTGDLAFTNGSLSAGNPGNEDGFGSFNQTINADGGYANAYTSVSFQIINNDSGGSWSSANDVLALNKTGFAVAAHIFVSGGSASGTSGYAADGAQPTPEPASLTLWGMMALGGVACSRWRKKQRAD